MRKRLVDFRKHRHTRLVGTAGRAVTARSVSVDFYVVIRVNEDRSG